MTARSKAWVCDRSLAGIACSNPAGAWRFVCFEGCVLYRLGGRIKLRWIFRKWEGVVGTGWSWLRIGTGVGHL